MHTRFDVNRIYKQPGIAAVLCRGSAPAGDPESAVGLDDKDVPATVVTIMRDGIDSFRACADLKSTRTRIDGAGKTVSVIRLVELDEIVAIAFEDGHPVVKSLIRAVRNAARAATRGRSPEPEQLPDRGVRVINDPEIDDDRDAVERRHDF
jgi:hypothetical protein